MGDFIVERRMRGVLVLRLLVAVVAVLTFLRPSAWAATYNVSNVSEFTAALSSAQGGDIIRLAAGTYTQPTGNTTFEVKAGVQLVGAGVGTTVIQSLSGVSQSLIHVGSGAEVRLSNISFQSLGSAGWNQLGGINLGAGANLVVEGCAFSMSADQNGACIYATGASVQVVNTEFSNCKVGMYGGAIYMKGEGNLSVSDSKFFNCSAENGGGAISSENSHLSITNTEFNECKAPGSGDGGGAVRMQSGTMTLTDSYIYDCYANNKGGGICVYAATITVENTRFHSNLVGTDWGGEGGGIYIANNASLTMSKSTIVDNAGNNGGGGIFIAGVNTVNLDFCTVALNTSATWTDGSGVSQQTWSGKANITVSNSIISGNKGAKDLNTSGINILNSLVGSDYWDDDGSKLTTMSNVDFVVDDDGTTNVAFPKTLDNGQINPVADDDGWATIGAGGGGSKRVSVKLKVVGNIMCRNQQATLQVEISGFSGVVEYVLYRYVGNTKEKCASSDRGTFTYTVTDNVATVKFEVVVTGAKSSANATIEALVIPLVNGGKINHTKNVVDS